MTTTRLLAIGLGAGLLLGSGAAVAQSRDDDRQSSPADAVTQPLGNTTGQSGATSGSDRSTQSGQSGSSPLGASGSNPAQQNLSFGVLDLNTDGKLSKDEVKGNATLTTDFSKLDTDRNGSLSNGEFAAFEGKAGNGSSDAKSDAKSTRDKAQDKRTETKNKAQDQRDRAKDNAQDTRDDVKDRVE